MKIPLFLQERVPYNTVTAFCNERHCMHTEFIAKFRQICSKRNKKRTIGNPIPLFVFCGIRFYLRIFKRELPFSFNSSIHNHFQGGNIQFYEIGKMHAWLLCVGGKVVQILHYTWHDKHGHQYLQFYHSSGYLQHIHHRSGYTSSVVTRIRVKYLTLKKP